MNEMSNTSIGGRRLTWPELVEHQAEEIRRLRLFASLVSDLDRCEHGRHEGDHCSGCGGPSRGNPFVADGTGDTVRFHRRVFERDVDDSGFAPRQIGYTMLGQRIVMPEPERRHDAAAWIAQR